MPAKALMTAAAAMLAVASWSGAQGAGWTKKMKITMNTTSTGADIAGEVKAYPVAVILTAANFDFASAKPDGSDLRFTDASGAALPFEIESWDAAGKKAAVWVRTDVKGNDKAQHLTAHWGNPSAAAAGDGKKVFPKEDGWAAAWHLAESGAATAAHYKDASANAAHGTAANSAATGTAEGRVGPAVDLDVNKKQYIRIDNSTTNPLFQLNTNATYSIWAKGRSHKIAYQAIFAKGETGFRIHYYGLSTWPDNTDPVSKAAKHITEPCLDPADRCPLKGGNATAYKGTDVAMDKWFHLVLVVDNKKQIYYINGVLEVQDGGGNVTSGSEVLAIGNNADRARSYDGLLDEARIANVARSADWVRLDYESQKEGSRFLEYEGASVAVHPVPSLPGPAAWTHPAAGMFLSRYDLEGRRVAALRSSGDARMDESALRRSSRAGLHVDRWTDGGGAVRERKILVH